MDYSKFNFDEEYDVSPMKDENGKFIANINFEAYLTDEQYNEVIMASDLCKKYFNGEERLLNSFIDDCYEKTVYVNLNVEDVLNGNSPTKVNVEIHAWSEIYAEEHGVALLVGEVELTNSEEAELTAKLANYVREWDGNTLENAIFVAKCEALDNIARSENFPVGNFFKNNILEIQQNDEKGSYNVFIDDALQALVDRTGIYRECGVTDYNSLLNETDITIYTEICANGNDILVSIIQESENRGMKSYNVPMRAEEAKQLYSSIQEFIAEQEKETSVKEDSIENTFKEMLKCMHFELHDTAEYAKTNDLGLADISHIEDISDYANIEEFATDFPYLIVNTEDCDNIHSAAVTALGVIENLETYIEDYFEDDILDEMSINGIASDYVSNPVSPTYDNICRIGQELAHSDDKNERVFYEEHKFEFEVFDMLVNSYDNVDIGKITVEGKPLENKDEIKAYMQYKEKWITDHISEEAYKQTMSAYNDYITEEYPVKGSDEYSFAEYVDEFGFSGGELYVCFDEWRECEYAVQAESKSQCGKNKKTVERD